MSQISVIGSISIDLVAISDIRPHAGETVFGKEFLTLPGGKGANQTVALSRLGFDTKIFGVVGDDAYGRQAIENLRNNGVNVDFVLTSPHSATGVAHIVLAEEDNSIIIIQGANNLVDKIYIDSILKEILSSDVVLLQHEIPLETIKYIINFCYDNKIKIILNPAPAVEISPEILEKINFVIPNEYELLTVFKNEITDTDNKEIVSNLLKKYANKLIVTYGSKGVIFNDGEREVTVPSIKADVVDTTGAGDSFCAAFAGMIAKGENIENAIIFANCTAGISVENLGAQGGFPTFEAVCERMKQISK